MSQVGSRSRSGFTSRRGGLLLIASTSLFVPILSLLFNRLIMTTTAPTPAPVPHTNTASGVIVVGSGLAGLSACSELIAQKVPVRLLERAAKPGGNSIKASSGINGAPTRFQKPVQEETGEGDDSLFYDDTVRSAGAALTTTQTELRRRLISVLTGSSAEAVNWLVDEKKIDLSKVARLGGHSRARTHRGAGQTPPGASIVMTLLAELKNSPLFTLQTEAEVTKVLRAVPGGDGGGSGPVRVVGVEYTHAGETRSLDGLVIFASGGFAGDAQGMLARFRPDLAGFPSTNDPRPGSQSLLTDVGAQLVDMEMVQVHPTGFVDSKTPTSSLKFLAAEVLRGEGGLLLRDGRRFVNEMQTRAHITGKIMEAQADDESPRQWHVKIVLDEATYEAAKSHVDFYIWKGLMQKTTVGELDAVQNDNKNKKNAAVPSQSIQEYANAAAGLSSDPFERKSFGHWKLKDVRDDCVIYVGTVTPVVHFTMGGVVISEQSEVLDHATGKAIDGLWAAGEVTGGIHGENRLGGSSLLECVVFGRRAGMEAARYFGTDS